MPPTLMAPDRQATYMPVWFVKCAQFPRVYATRDIDIPSITPGVGFNVGDSVIGGDDLVGGGAGPLWRQAYRGILNTPVVTRKIGEPQWPMVDVQDVTVEIAHDGELLGDWRGATFTLSAYDAGSGFLLLQGAFVVFQAAHNRGVITITGKNVDLSILEAQIPKGTITTAEFPLAAPDAIGACPTWIFGNVTNAPVYWVRDDQITSQFDGLLARDTRAAIIGLRRVNPNVAGLPIAMTFDELEPYPGQDGVGVNLGLEDWDAGVTSDPDGWVRSGAGATIAKNITAGQFDEGNASASLTAAAANTQLLQSLSGNVPALPISWWQLREITVTMRIRAVVAGRVTVRIQDGVATVDSTFHTGGGAFETLTVGTVAVPFIIAGAATGLSISARIVAGAATTIQIDKVRVYLRAKNWNECLRPDLYPGYTALRCFLRQEDSSGALFQLVADVHGLQPERHPIRAIRTLLSDPTHGLGKPVDATTFDAMEAALCFVYDDAVRLDGPQVYIKGHDPIENTELGEPPETIGDMTNAGGLARDRSGYERHARASISNPGAYSTTVPAPSGGVGDAYIDAGAGGFTGQAFFTVPYDVRPGFESPDAITLETWYYIDAAVVNAGDFPLCEKRVDVFAGGALPSGHALWHDSSSSLVFSVRNDSGVTFEVHAPLTAPADVHRWMHVVGKAAGGVLGIYKDGALVATDTYDGSLAVGEGAFVWAQSDWGGMSPARYWYSRAKMYSTALSDARIAAHHAAITLDVDPVSTFDEELAGFGPTFYYLLAENAGEVIMRDVTGAHHGAWVGGPLLGPGVPGPLTTERGYVLGSTAARFQNNIAKYGVETGMALNETQGLFGVWYRPAVMGVNAGLIEKTIGSPGVRGSQWGLCQRTGGTAAGRIRLTFVATSGTYTLDAPLTPEDIGRYLWISAQFSNSLGTVRLYKNGALIATAAYTGTAVSGVGDFYVGCQGTAGGPLTRPAQGDLGRVHYLGDVVLTDAEMAHAYLAAMWYNGGLVVDAALREPRAARAWLEQFCVLRGIRLGMTPEGPITVTCDAAPATTIRLHARDGAGDGERTIKAIGDSQYPPLDETVADVVVRGRRDLLSNAWLVERRRTVHSNMGTDKFFDLDCVREYPALDRVAAYLAGTILDGEKTVDVTMGQEARQLMEAELVMVTDALMGYDAAITRARTVEKSLPQHSATVSGWSEAPYTWTPTSFPSGSTSG